MQWKGRLISTFTKEELKAALTELKLPVSGLKAALEARLRDAIRAQADELVASTSAVTDEDLAKAITPEQEETLHHLTNDGLRDILKEMGLPGNGKKIELIERIKLGKAKELATKVDDTKVVKLEQQSNAPLKVGAKGKKAKEESTKAATQPEEEGAVSMDVPTAEIVGKKTRPKSGAEVDVNATEATPVENASKGRRQKKTTSLIELERAPAEANPIVAGPLHEKKHSSSTTAQEQLEASNVAAEGRKGKKKSPDMDTQGGAGKLAVVSDKSDETAVGKPPKGKRKKKTEAPVEPDRSSSEAPVEADRSSSEAPLNVNASSVAKQGDLSEMSYQGLRVALKEVGLPSGGTKAELLDRLKTFRNTTGSVPTEAVTPGPKNASKTKKVQARLASPPVASLLSSPSAVPTEPYDEEVQEEKRSERLKRAREKRQAKAKQEITAEAPASKRQKSSNSKEDKTGKTEEEKPNLLQTQLEDNKKAIAVEEIRPKRAGPKSMVKKPEETAVRTPSPRKASVDNLAGAQETMASESGKRRVRSGPKSKKLKLQHEDGVTMDVASSVVAEIQEEKLDSTGPIAEEMNATASNTIRSEAPSSAPSLATSASIPADLNVDHAIPSRELQDTNVPNVAAEHGENDQLLDGTAEIVESQPKEGPEKMKLPAGMWPPTLGEDDAGVALVGENAEDEATKPTPHAPGIDMITREMMQATGPGKELAPHSGRSVEEAVREVASDLMDIVAEEIVGMEHGQTPVGTVIEQKAAFSVRFESVSSPRPDHPIPKDVEMLGDSSDNGVSSVALDTQTQSKDFPAAEENGQLNTAQSAAAAAAAIQALLARSGFAGTGRPDEMTETVESAMVSKPQGNSIVTATTITTLTTTTTSDMSPIEPPASNDIVARPSVVDGDETAVSFLSAANQYSSSGVSFATAQDETLSSASLIASGRQSIGPTNQEEKPLESHPSKHAITSITSLLQGLPSQKKQELTAKQQVALAEEQHQVRASVQSMSAEAVARRDAALLDDLEKALWEATAGGITPAEFEILDAVLLSFAQSQQYPQQTARAPIVRSPRPHSTTFASPSGVSPVGGTMVEMDASFMHVAQPTPKNEVAHALWTGYAPTPILPPRTNPRPTSGWRPTSIVRPATGRPPVPLFSSPGPIAAAPSGAASTITNINVARPKGSAVAERIRNALKEDQVAVTHFKFTLPPRVLGIPPLVRQDMTNNAVARSMFRFDSC